MYNAHVCAQHATPILRLCVAKHNLVRGRSRINRPLVVLIHLPIEHPLPVVFILIHLAVEPWEPRLRVVPAAESIIEPVALFALLEDQLAMLQQTGIRQQPARIHLETMLTGKSPGPSTPSHTLKNHDTQG